MMSLEEVTQAIAAIDGDPAMCSALRARLRLAAPNFVAQFSHATRLREQTPFPMPSTITAAQMSLFDNWIEFGGKRPKRGEQGHYRDRFKVTFDLWTDPVETLDLKKQKPAYSVTSHLWTGAEIVNRAKQRKGSLKLPKVLSEDFRNWLVAQAEQMAPTDRMGLVYTDLGKSVVYHDEVFVAATSFANHDTEQVIVSGPQGTFMFEGFTRTTSRGNKLAMNCFAHARMTTSPKLAAAWGAHLIPTDEQVTECNAGSPAEPAKMQVG